MVNRFGKGQVLYAPVPLFTDYNEFPDEDQRRFLLNLIACLAPAGDRPVVAPDLPHQAEVSLMEQDGRWFFHILRGGADPPELRDVAVVLRPPFEPVRVYTAPAQEDVPFERVDAEIRVVLPAVGGHTILVLES